MTLELLRQQVEELRELNLGLEQRLQECSAEREQVSERLRELNRLKDEFLAITSHDLRSPLGNILTAAQLLLKSNAAFSEAERTEMLATIEDTARHLINLVNDMLDLAKMEAGQLQLECSALLLSEVAQQSVEAFQFNARAKRIDISLHIEGAERTVQGDKLKLYRVINNLLSNAIKFTPPGGSVQVVIAPESNGMRLSVSDTGLGIAPEDRSLLFEKFRQTRTQPTSGEKGTGLGLAIVRQLVELHGGTVEVQSELHKGSTFTLHLPA